MKKLAYTFTGLILAASAAHAQPAPESASEAAGPEAHGAIHAEAAVPATPADPASESAALPAEPATPAEPAAEVAAGALVNVTDADIDSFAQATVKLQAIEADTTIAAAEKQTAMVSAVAEVGLDAVKYNAIGKAASANPELRTKVQTAMSKYAPQPSDG